MALSSQTAHIGHIDRFRTTSSISWRLFLESQMGDFTSKVIKDIPHSIPVLIINRDLRSKLVVLSIVIQGTRVCLPKLTVKSTLCRVI